MRTTSFIALAFGAVALLAALLSVYVMASRPWGCSATSASSVVSCDWVTSRWVAAGWLVVTLAICLVSWKRWALALATLSLPLLVFSMISFLGLFTLAPSAFWFGCALWLGARDRGLWIAVSGVATVVIVSVGVFGMLVLFTLASSPS